MRRETHDPRASGVGVAHPRHLAEGWTVDAIVDEFPGIEVDDVRACIAYAAQLANARFADLDDVA